MSASESSSLTQLTNDNAHITAPTSAGPVASRAVDTCLGVSVGETGGGTAVIGSHRECSAPTRDRSPGQIVPPSSSVLATSVTQAGERRAATDVAIYGAGVDLADFQAVNSLYAEMFGTGISPARACVQVAALPKGSRVEIDCIAWLG